MKMDLRAPPPHLHRLWLLTPLLADCARTKGIRRQAGQWAGVKQSPEVKIYGFFFAAFAAVVILGIVTYQTTRNLMATDKSVTHTLEVRDSLDELLGAVQGAENGRRGYLLTGDSQYQLQFEAGAAQIRPDVKKIALLTADEPDQQERIEALTASTEKTIAIWEEIAAHLPKGKADAAAQIELTNKGADVTARIIQSSKR